MTDVGVTDGEMSVRAARLWLGSKGTPESLHVVRIVCGESEKSKAERVNGGAESEARKSAISYVLRIAVEEKLDSVKRELKRCRRTIIS